MTFRNVNQETMIL